MIGPFRGKYRFLSNFYPVQITDGVIQYSSVEHAYQASKFLNIETKIIISQLEKPGATKRFGRYIQDQIRLDWEDVKLDLMYGFVTQKFNYPILREKLLKTGTDELVEINSWNDIFWGVCNDVGENHLGKILMEVRDNLRK